MTRPPLAQRLAGFGAAAYAQTLAVTLRWRELRDAQADKALSAGPAILCFWHQHILMLARPMGRVQRPAALVSRSRDGGAAALAVARFGVLPIRASRAKPGKSDKGGLEGFVQMAAHLTGGGVLALAPDGPRGPACHCAPGIAQLARFTGVPIIGLGAATTLCKRANSWDRTVLPLPWARAALVWGAPVYVSRKADAAALHACTQALEEQLNQLDAQAHTALAHTALARADLAPAILAPPTSDP